MKRVENNYREIDARDPAMKFGFRFPFLNTVFSFVLILLLLVACNGNETAHDHDTYTCPMHPTVVSEGPGTCPVCGMDLVRKARAGEEVEITEDLSKLLRSPNETVVASVRTIKGEYKALPVAVQAQGVVTYDTRKIFSIPARVGGRLEKVYLKHAFQSVVKGQKIAEVYSPELITAQRELLFLQEHDAGNEALINGAKRKLELLGMSRSQIDELIKRKETNNTFIVYSPYSGYLITDAQIAPSLATATSPAQSTGGGMADGMGAGSAATSRTQGTSQGNAAASIPREGDYVTAGQTLFTVVNPTALRIELNLPGTYNGAVKEGNKVELSFDEGAYTSATVDFVQPFFTEGQKFQTIRIYTSQTEGLHIGHLVNATIRLQKTESLWVPREAVLDLGVQKVVFVKQRGMLKPKHVTTGISADGMTEIRGGLASSEEIAANAQYLVDSESFIKVGK